MNAFDLIVGLLLLAIAVAGWRVGLARVVLPIAASVGVLWAASRFAPDLIVEHTSPSDVDARRWLVVAAFIVVPLLAGLLVSGFIAGTRRGADPGATSRFLGALAAVATVLLLVWVIAPVTLRRHTVTLPADSFTAKVIAELPDAPFDLDEMVARDVVPPQFAHLLGDASSAPPTELPAMTPATQRLVRDATVQVFAEACGKEWAGSGFVAAPGVVVTNAHVVTGAGGVDVVTADGRAHTATVTLYDPARDVALLRLPGLDIIPLALAESPAAVGDVVVSAGHPGGDDEVHIAPARVDSYGFVEIDLPPAGPASRLVYRLASADLAPGSSGGPIVNGRGQVIAVDFAGDEHGRSAAFAISEIRADLANPGTEPAATGAC